MAREEMTLTGKTTTVLYQTSAIKKPQTVVYWVVRYIWRIWGTADVNKVILGPENKGQAQQHLLNISISNQGQIY